MNARFLTGGGILLAIVMGTVCAANAEPVLLTDFADAEHGWTGNPNIGEMKTTPEGLLFSSTGLDPWIESPPLNNMPTGVRVRLTFRLKSDGDSHGEIYYGADFSKERRKSVFIRADGEWHEYTCILPEQEPGTRLRLDPARGEGVFAIAWMKAEAIAPLAAPPLPPPVSVPFDLRFEVVSGDLALVHNGRDWDGYTLFVEGAPMAGAYANSALGLLLDGKPVLQSLQETEIKVMAHNRSSLTLTSRFTDMDGAEWNMSRIIAAGKHPGTLIVRTAISANKDREVYHLPWLTLFPGLESFGEEKNQAVLPGVEYLENEPSSSEADFNAAQADRRVVDDYKLTLPMMALQHEGRYIGMVWNRSDHPAVVFDSPDRVFNSNSHLMALWHPGVGNQRFENEITAFQAFTLQKEVPISLDVMIIGGKGESVVPAVRHYVALRGIPPLPELTGGFDVATKLLASGWLDSAAHHDGLWQHAVWGDSFPPRPAADAPAYMEWLAQHTEEQELSQRLRHAAQRGLERLEPAEIYTGSVSHTPRPAPVLLFGNITKNVESMVSRAQELLGRFDESGVCRYRQPDPNGADFGRTHFADHANGYAAQPLEIILESAAFSGDIALKEAALTLFDKQMALYAHSVPRGAQTWEMPLHTPDILASARLVRCYTLAYLISNQDAYLEQARYWAWTGVPFLYLDAPVDAPVGLYASIAVLGATHWVAPNWIGQPVQWCGLVYRSAIQELARVDTVEGIFWNQIAQGVTRSGLQQTFPLTDEKRRGLLPDYFLLREQIPEGPAINPGTVQTHLAEAFGKTPFFRMIQWGGHGLIHAPGEILQKSNSPEEVVLSIDAWPDAPYWIRITGATETLQVLWNDAEPEEKEHEAQHNALNLRLTGDGVLVLRSKSEN